MVVGLGEALFDCFGDRAVLGGAPVNFAVHTAALLGAVDGGAVVVSRVGRDDLGDRVIRELRERGVATAAIQRDAALPTGTVDVALDERGEPAYTINAGVAWESLTFDAGAEALAKACDAVCFGTLAQRTAAGGEAVGRFVEAAASAVRMLDVNLRPGFEAGAVVEMSLRHATVLKLNEAELPAVCAMVGVGGGDAEGGAQRDRAMRLIERFKLEAVALTRGSQGTVLFTRDRAYEGEPGRFDPVPGSDSVGAGDACGAGLVVGTLLGASPRATVSLANAMGAYVASQPGGTPTLPAEVIAMVREMAAG